jgi:predicted RND superfamily exporter protein
MGAIMTIGVATANSILMVTFANDQLRSGMNSLEAALQAGATRLRPVLMTAGAMIIGMFPMALGLGEGGEQNAPLGRAVIGGLIGATVTTLFVVPIIYSYLRTKPPVNQERRLEEGSPRHQVQATASVKLPRQITVDWFFRHVSALPALAVPAYSTSNVTVQMGLNREFSLIASGRNLHQATHVEFSEGGNGLIGIRRSGYIGLRWTR